jgi:hypothetical protein
VVVQPARNRRIETETSVTKGVIMLIACPLGGSSENGVNGFHGNIEKGFTMVNKISLPCALCFGIGFCEFFGT